MKSKESSLLAAFTHPSGKPRGQSGLRRRPPAPCPGARLGNVSGQAPVREPGTCAHTHARTRTTVSPHACTPVRLCALVHAPQPHRCAAPRAGGPRQRSLQQRRRNSLEEDEGDIKCVQVSTQLQGQRDLEEGRVDALARGARTWGSSSPEVRRS